MTCDDIRFNSLLSSIIHHTRKWPNAISFCRYFFADIKFVFAVSLFHVVDELVQRPLHSCRWHVRIMPTNHNFEHLVPDHHVLRAHVSQFNEKFCQFANNFGMISFRPSPIFWHPQAIMLDSLPACCFWDRTNLKAFDGVLNWAKPRTPLLLSTRFTCWKPLTILSTRPVLPQCPCLQIH